MFELLGYHDLDWDGIELFQVDERVAPEGDDDRNLTHLLASLPPAGARERSPDAGRRPRTSSAAAARYAEQLPARSTSSTSASGLTATPPRWSRATRCSRSRTGSSRSPASTRAAAG